MAVTLDQILASTRLDLPELSRRRNALEREAADRPAPPSLRDALRGDRVRVVAEVKRRSPSAGVIRDDLEPGERSALYAEQGAAAISVLTDGPHFGGSVADLRAAVSRVVVPVLRKDFILDELQIIEARAAGAAAVLLIVRALSPERLRTLLASARSAGLAALVEVHSAAELDRALEAGADIVGVNSRDLDTFRIDVASAWELLETVPGELVAVAESGMRGREDVERAAAAGADAVLIGTALSAAADPALLLRDLARVPHHGR
ncbi:MAG TPA: indole-3-glycerol phosphate synthase TrpC [Gemmatimonadales bacterium]|nr:indole-3-glycerol phosphate synthase TrpC [Gemmatimonadales bacterium]